MSQDSLVHILQSPIPCSTWVRIGSCKDVQYMGEYGDSKKPHCKKFLGEKYQIYLEKKYQRYLQKKSL
jgi:hypothetical protein